MIKNGLDIYRQDDDFNTLFGSAIRYGTPDIVRACVEAGADIFTVDYNSCPIGADSPLVSAIRAFNPDTLKELINLGADVQLLDTTDEIL